MKKNTLFLVTIIVLALLVTCNEKKKLRSNKTKCENLKNGYRLIKEGKQKSAAFEKIFEYLKDVSTLEIDIEDPITDNRHATGRTAYNTFSNNLTKSLYVDYNGFKNLIKANSNYPLLRIQYVYLLESTLQELVNDISSEEEKKQVIDSLKKHQNNLYAILTFTNKTNVQLKSYLIFDLGTKNYPIKVDEKLTYDNFKQNISPILHNPNYIARSIIYDSKKVNDYFGRIDEYISACGMQTITKLRFDFCYGVSKSTHTKESIFTTSMPMHSNGKDLESFPYYDQGSLEP